MTPFRRVLREKLFSWVGQQMSLVKIRNCSDVPEHLEPRLGPTDTQSKKSKQFLNHQPVMVERLKTRSVLTVSGPDSIAFLNNLTTNELSQLKTDATCLHTFFLNAKGKIIHDALIYRPDEDDTLFVECDIASLQALQTHLIMFSTSKMEGRAVDIHVPDGKWFRDLIENPALHISEWSKTNVEIRDVEQDVGVWSVYDPMEIEAVTTPGAGNSEAHDSSFLEDLELGEDVLLSRDPRMWPLGVRILAPKDIDISVAMKSAGVNILDAPNGTYKSVRYRLGVAEGKAEIGFGRSLPAEINGDQTNAISLTKSNYTGWSPAGLKKAVNYRMLPLRFHGNTSTMSVNTEITDRKGKKRSPIGFLRGVQNSYGLGLMHIPSVLADRACLVGKLPAECIRPPWWKNEFKAPGVQELKKVSQ